MFKNLYLFVNFNDEKCLIYFRTIVLFMKNKINFIYKPNTKTEAEIWAKIKPM